jgi:hypothetical protein
MRYGQPLPTSHPYSQIVNKGVLHGYNDAFAPGATPTHIMNEMEPEYFNIDKEHYHCGRAALSDSMFSEFRDQFMPPKRKRGTLYRILQQTIQFHLISFSTSTANLFRYYKLHQVLNMSYHK